MRVIISIIIITYERDEDLIIKAIESINKNKINKEIIVINNGSQKLTRIKKMNVKYIKTKKNLGVTGGRNLGINISKGKYLIFLDDDAEILTSDYIERILKHFEDESVAAIAFNVKRNQGHVRKEIPVRKIPNNVVKVGYFVGAGHALRKSAIKKVGLYPDDFIYSCEELDLSYRLINYGYEIIFDPNIMVIHKVSKAGRIPDSKLLQIQLVNRWKVCIRNLPLYYMLPHLFVWTSFYFFSSIIRLSIKSFMKGLFLVLKEYKDIAKQRYPLNNRAIQYLKKTKGRLWW